MAVPMSRAGRGAVPKKRIPPAIWIGLGSILALALAVGAFLYFRPASGGEAKALCYLLIDRTSSASSDEFKAQQQAAADAAVAGCAEQQALLLIAVFDQSGPSITPQGSFPLFPEESRNATQQERAVDAQRQAAEEQIQQIFDPITVQEQRGTDAVSALRSASDELAQSARDVPADRRYLIVLSDGIQMSPAVSVETFLGQFDVDAEVAKLEGLDLLPALDGAKVIFVGPGNPLGDGGLSEPDPVLVDQLSKNIRDFWAKVVERGGGVPCRYEETSTLLPGDCRAWGGDGGA